MDREQFEIGIAEFNEGRFFECHDTFEAMWMEERGEARRFLQGLIQGAVGILHATRGNLAGAASQLEKALAKLVEYPERYCGIDVDALRTDLAALRASFGSGEGGLQFDPDLIPTIDYTHDPAALPPDLSSEP